MTRKNNDFDAFNEKMIFKKKGWDFVTSCS